jgi:integrase
MRQKSDYQLYPRSLKSGKKVYYYYAYDHTGKRRGKSTGQTTLSAARNWVNRQLKQGNLVTSGAVRFSDWARDWWIWDKCGYIKSCRGAIGRMHADQQRWYLTTYILPYFQAMKLENIGPSDVEAWIAKLQRDGRSANMINHCLRTLNTMFNEAERLEHVTRNPARTVRRLREPKKEIKLLTVEEVGKLFADENYATFWSSHIVHYTLNLMAASTGLRMGELQALTVDNCYPDHIHVVGSWTRHYGVVGDSEQKRHERYVPLPSVTAAKLQQLCNKMGGGWVFTVNRTEPVNHSTIAQFFRRTMERAGIDAKGRGLSFHSWRHWFNTTMRSHGVDGSKLRGLTGHQSEQMTDRYTDYRPEDFADVKQIQDTLF